MSLRPGFWLRTLGRRGSYPVRHRARTAKLTTSPRPKILNLAGHKCWDYWFYLESSLDTSLARESVRLLSDVAEARWTSPQDPAVIVPFCNHQQNTEPRGRVLHWCLSTVRAASAGTWWTERAEEDVWFNRPAFQAIPRHPLLSAGCGKRGALRWRSRELGSDSAIHDLRAAPSPKHP